MNEISVRMENRAVFVRPGDPKVLSWSLDLDKFRDLKSAVETSRELDDWEWPTFYVNLSITKKPEIRIRVPTRMLSGSVALKALRPQLRPQVAWYAFLHRRGEMDLHLDGLGTVNIRALWSDGDRQELAAIDLYLVDYEPFLDIAIGLPLQGSRHLLDPTRSRLLLRANLKSLDPELSIETGERRGTTARLPDYMLAACCCEHDVFFLALLLREENYREVESWMRKICGEEVRV